MDRAKAEIIRVARSLFAPGVLIGVVPTGDGKDERGHAFMVVDPVTRIGLGVQGTGLQVFRFTEDQIGRMRAAGQLLSSLELGGEAIGSLLLRA